MDPKVIMKTAQERISQLDKENAELKKYAQDKEAELKAAMEKVSYYEREKKVEHILDVLIDEKSYFPQSQRQEKRAYLMNGDTDLDAYMKMAGELTPMQQGMFYEESSTPASKDRDGEFYDALLRKLSGSMYGD